ncbi:hypothetical protein ACHAXT_009050 [Thalassiosira profunda]
MASILSVVALSIDHQRKVVKRAKGNDGTQSFAVVGDGNTVLAYVVVPDTNMTWAEQCMREILARHGATLAPDDCNRLVERGTLPPVVYVDCNCCNGKVGGRTDETAVLRLLKLLDAFHAIQRIGKQINSEHDRKGRFMQQISACIFTRSDEDMRALEAARMAGNIRNLSTKQQKKDRERHVRRVIRDKEAIVAKLIMLLKTQILLDRKIRAAYERSGKSCADLSPAHDAYPLITKKVKDCIIRQCVHVLNGCLEDVQAMNVAVGEVNYRNTGVMLMEYKSLRGTNGNEAMHSVMDRKMYATNHIRKLYFDAKAHWNITHYNRVRLGDMGKEVLPHGVAPHEDDSIAIVASTDLLFGFAYCDSVLKAKEDDIHREVMAALANDELAIEDLEMDGLEAVAELDDLLNNDEETDVATCSDSTLMGAGVNVSVPPLAVDIPAVIDVASLEQLDCAFDRELGRPVGSENSLPIEVDEVVTPANVSTLQQCSRAADQMAADGGITFADDTTTADFVQLHGVNGTRRVGVRRKQAQQAPKSWPGMNLSMRTKWEQIWAERYKCPHPGEGSTSMHQWVQKASYIYEIWMADELKKAKEAKLPRPPLETVGYTEAANWAKEKMASASEGRRRGIVDEATQAISTSLDAVMESDNGVDEAALFGDEDGLGVARVIDSLQMISPSASADSSPGFPTTTEVSAAMEQLAVSQTVDDELQGLLKKPAKKRAKKKATSPADAERKRRALIKLQSLGMTADKPAGRSRPRCGICNKYFDTELVVQLEGEEARKLPHRQMGHVNGKRKDFCPFADDSGILKQHLIDLGERRQQSQKDTYKKRKSSVGVVEEE